MNKKQRFAIGPILFLHTLSWGAAIGGFALTWEAGRRIIQGVWDTDDALLYGLVGVPLGLCSWGSITFAITHGYNLVKRLSWSMSTYPSRSQAAERMGLTIDEVNALIKDGKIEPFACGDVHRASVDAYMNRCDKERDAK